MRGLGMGLGFTRRKHDGVGGLIPVPSPLAIVRDDQTDFTTWVPAGTTVNANAAPNYDGSGDCDQTRSDVTVGLHGIGVTLSALVSGVVYYADLVLKPDGRDFILFQVAGAGVNVFGIFDLLTNTIGDSLDLDDWDVQDLSNGWKFIRMVFTADASVLHAANVFHATSGTNYTMAGDTSKGFLLDRYVLSRNP